MNIGPRNDSNVNASHSESNRSNWKPFLLRPMYSVLLIVFSVQLLCSEITVAQITATWTGSGDGVNYSDAGNWDSGVVPINGGGSTFNVVVPGNVSVAFDVAGAGNQVDALQLDSGATLTLGLGTDIAVLNTASIDDARIFVDVGASAVIPVQSYRANAGGTVFSADGPGSSLDLSTMQTWSQSNFGGTVRRSVIATGTASIDLSGLVSISNSSGDDDVEFRMASGGSIDLSNLTTIDGPAFFNVEAATFSLPSLGTTSGGGMSITRSAASTTSLPILLSNDGGTWNVPAGGSINAPVMTQFRNSVLNIGTGGSLNATSLVDVAGSTINFGGGQTLNTASLLEIDNARLLLSGGATLATADTDYESNITGTVMSADGTGTNLDLSSLQTWSQDNFGGFVRRSVVSSGGASIDLSSLSSIANSASDDDIEFRTLSGGTIDLSNLTTIDGPVYLNVDTPGYSLPSLMSVSGGLSIDRPAFSTISLPALQSSDGGLWNVPEGGSINATAVSQLQNTIVNIADGGTLNIPVVSDISGSTINLGSNQTINAASITSMDNSRLFVSEGATFTVAATEYSSNVGGVVFSADGSGSSLDLSTMQTWSQSNLGGFVRRSAVSTGGGQIDLSGLTSINNTASDDDIEFRTTSGGTIALNNLATIEGPVFFNIEGASYTLPSLATVTGGMTLTRSAGSTTDLPALLSSTGGTWTVPAGGSINATALTELRSTNVVVETGGALNAPNVNNINASTINLGASQTLNIGPIQQMDNARLLLSGGATLATADVDYLADVSGTLLSADGTGTVLDVSSIKTWTQNNFGGFARRTVSASGGGHVDLSGLETIQNNATDDDVYFQAVTGGSIDLSKLTTVDGPIVLDVETAGHISVGSPSTVAGGVTIDVADLGSRLSVTGDLLMGPQTTIQVTDAAALEIGGNFSHQATTESDVELSVASVWMNGSGGQFIEVASEDLGVDGSTSGNFGMGQLQVGDINDSTAVNLLDAQDNGNRNGGAEALYLFGLGGPEGLRIAGGSVLVLNGIDVYAFDSLAGGQVHINSLFGPGDFRIPYDGGFLQLAVGDFLWTNAGGGNFGVNGNWQGGITPLIADNAAWDLGSSGYTVTFAGSVGTNSAVVRNDTVSFDLNGHDYKIGGGGVPHALVLAQAAGQQANLTVKNGNIAATSAMLAQFSGSTASLTIDNANVFVKSSLTFGEGTARLELTNGGRLIVAERLELGPAGDIDLTDGTVTVGSFAQLPANRTLQVTSGGRLSGSGAIDGNLDTEGIIEALVNSVTDHDLISVTGTATLDGTIDVKFSSDPALGSEIVILEALGGISGSFTDFIGVDTTMGTWAAVVEYTATTVRLFTTLPGDANLDGFVDGNDFLIWNSNKLTGATGWRNGDFNGDASIDGEDFQIWSQFKFQSIDDIVAIPEPAFAGLLWFLAAAAVRSRRQA